jgi:hypothetical protein
LNTTRLRLARVLGASVSLAALTFVPALACSSSSTSTSATSPDGGGATTDSGGSTTTDGSRGDSSTTADGGFPSGWLYTMGSKIMVSTGSGGQPWMGRGVNVDDIYFCGYDNTLWMTTPDQTLKQMISGMISTWKPNLVRISLSMDSYPTVSTWVGTDTMYKAPMTGVIQSILANPNVYVLVTLRSDASMIGQDTSDGDAEATGLPSDSTSTPDKTKYPTGTDATYAALVDTFGSAPNVLFGLTNEPGGDKLSSSTIAAAMTHAVGVIRAEEDKNGVPHHLVSAQGQGWTSDISFYSTTPIPFDNVVYEVHGYPPATSSYTYSNIPVIIGEYGSLSNSTAFYADVEAKKIPNIAWDFDSYNDCAPDLANVTQSATNLTASSWGMVVQAYLTAHAGH